jgi:hypothetical protein
MIRFFLLVTATLVALSAAHAQSGAMKNNSGEVEILFANGSLVRLTLEQEKIDIETLYGKLNVPLKDIRRIEFGLHVPDGVDKKVEVAIKKLASGDFKERDGAVHELVTFGAYAYPALLLAAKSSDPEVAKRATDAVARIRAKVPAKELKLAADDRVVTSKFTIVGRIITPSIKARTEYFGEAQLILPQLRHLRVLAESRDAELTIDAAKYSNANEWLETNVTIDGTSILSIAATGQVDLCPQMPGTIVAGPKGHSQGAVGGFGGADGGFGGPGGIGGAAPAGKGKKGGGFGPAAKNLPGALLGRIGENGDIFLIGARFEGIPESEGKLYLHINPTQFDTASSGTYQVRIVTKN